jgi:hypothetical protein
MITIHIKKPKSSQIKRTISGCGFRITEGDYPINVKKELVNKIRKKFSNGKSHTLYAHEFEGGSLASMYQDAKDFVITEGRQTARQLKKNIQTEVRQTARQLKKEAISTAQQLKNEAIETGREIKKQAIKEGNMFINDVARPYLSEMVQSGIMGLAGTASVLQPELAPFILTAGLTASAMAGNYIDEFGNKKPKPQPQTAYVSPQDYQVYQPAPSIVPEDYINPTEIARTKINDSIDDMQRANNMIGFGFGRNNHKVGNGLYAGGGLVSRDGYTPPSLMSPNPEFMLNRNLLPAYIQNQQFLK